MRREAVEYELLFCTLEDINRLREQLEGSNAGRLGIIQGIGVPGHGLPGVQEYGFQKISGRREGSFHTKRRDEMRRDD